MSLEIIGQSIPNMPWQDRPEGCDEVFWRYTENPILSYKDIKKAIKKQHKCKKFQKNLQ